MSEYTNSIILVGTQSARGTFNVLWREIGFDVAGSEGTLIVACSASGNDPASHYAAHIWERDAFVRNAPRWPGRYPESTVRGGVDQHESDSGAVGECRN